MMMIPTAAVSVIFALSFSVAFAADPCRFEHSPLGVIDLTTLGRTDGKAAYADQIPSGASDYKYSYNPCRPFTEGSACQNVSVCQIKTDGSSSQALGTQESTSWAAGPASGGTPLVSYYADAAARITIIRLQCSTNGTDHFEFEAEQPPGVYIFRLTHKCACWNGCSSTTTSVPTTSTTTSVAPTTSPSISTACQFVHPEKGIIDFSFIGRTDEKAAYSDETTRTASNFKYSFNPCRSFSQGSGCIGASVCQISKDGGETVIIGTQESAWWDGGSDMNSLPSLNYVYGDKKVSVLLQCSNEENNEFQAFGEDPVNTFKLQLTHKCACWNAC